MASYPPDKVAWSQRIGDEVVAFVQDHERRQHGGERCQTEAVNMLAWLAHKLGLYVPSPVSDEWVRAFAERLTDYQAVHHEHNVNEEVPMDDDNDPLEIHEVGGKVAPETEVPEEIEEKLQRLHGQEGDEEEGPEVTGG